MIRQENKLIITFHTTAEAMAMEEACKERCAQGRLIPVPRSITAGCGLAWCAPPQSEEALRSLMTQCGIRPQAVQQCMI